MFEDLWLGRRRVPPRAKRALDDALGRSPAFARELERSRGAVTAPAREESWDELG
jgi:hypothetical protein